MLELDEGKLSRPVLRRGGESNLASLSRPRCRALNLAKARRPSSPLQGSSPAKTRASSRPSLAHGHHLRPSIHCYKLSDSSSWRQNLYYFFVINPQSSSARIYLMQFVALQVQGNSPYLSIPYP